MSWAEVKVVEDAIKDQLTLSSFYGVEKPAKIVAVKNKEDYTNETVADLSADFRIPDFYLGLASYTGYNPPASLRNGCVTQYKNKMYMVFPNNNGQSAGGSFYQFEVQAIGTGVYTKLCDTPSGKYWNYTGATMINENRFALFGGGSTSGTHTGYHYTATINSTFTAETDLPWQFLYSAVCTFNNYIYVAGVGSGYTGVYKRSATVSGTDWTQINSTGGSLSGCRFVRYKGNIYLASGTSLYMIEQTSSGERLIFISSLPYQFSTGLVISDDRCIYLIGGTASGTGKRVYRYDGSTWTMCNDAANEIHDVHWSDDMFIDNYMLIPGVSANQNKTCLERLNTPLQTVNYNGDVYFVGIHTSYDSPSICKWNSTDGWSDVTTAPSEIDISTYAPRIVIYHNDMHFLGSNTTAYHTVHYKWNPTDGWVEVSTLPYDFYRGQAIVYNDEIHILSGQDSSVTRNHYKWNPTDGWREASTLPDFMSAAMSYFYVVTLNDGIHIIISNSSGTDPRHSVWNGENWNELTPPEYNIYNMAVKNINNGLYMFGGYGHKKDIEFYRNTWFTQADSLPTNIESSGHNASKEGNDTYILDETTHNLYKISPSDSVTPAKMDDVTLVLVPQ